MADEQSPQPESGPSGLFPQISTPYIMLTEQEKTLLHQVHRTCKQVLIESEFGGGYSGARVLLALPIMADDRRVAPQVTKLGPAFDLRHERDNYKQYVGPSLPFCVARLESDSYYEQDNQAGLNYVFVGGGTMGRAIDLDEYYRRALPGDSERIIKTLYGLLDGELGPSWYGQHRPMTCFLAAEYGRHMVEHLHIELRPRSSDALWIEGQSPPSTPSYRRIEAQVISREHEAIQPGTLLTVEGLVVKRIKHDEIKLHDPGGEGIVVRVKLAPESSIAQHLQVSDKVGVRGQVIYNRRGRMEQIVCQVFPDLLPRVDSDHIQLPGVAGMIQNPLRIYPQILGRTLKSRKSYVHGDLHLRNILVDELGKGWLIDFARVEERHNLFDFIKLETYVRLMELARDGPAFALDDYVQFERALNDAALGHAVSPPRDSHLLVAYHVIQAIRDTARKYMGPNPDFRNEYFSALFVYSLAVMKYHRADTPQPARLAFATASVLGQYILGDGNQARPSLHPPVENWGRLRRYVPAEMFRKIVENVSDEDKAKICLEHLSQLLRAVVTYLPHHLALELLREPVVAQNKGEFLQGTLLFADISDFTRLSEKLKEAGGQAGAETVVRVINTYLDLMLGILFKHDGQLVKFGGDAMLCLFTGVDQGAMNAVQAAWEMKEAMHSSFGEFEGFGEVLSRGETQVFQEVFPLDMKVGSNSGLLFAACVGDAEHMEYILTGSAVEHTAYVESAAHKGDVLVSHETYKLIQDRLEAEEMAERPGLYRIVNIPSGSAPADEASWSEIEHCCSLLANDVGGLAARLDALAAYLPAGVLPQLVYAPQSGQLDGQHRPATILFSNFVGMSKIIQAHSVNHPEKIASDLSEYFKAMQEEIRYYGGVINKADLYDQGDKLMVIFGAPIAHERDAHRAALTALKMQEAMEKLCSPIAAACLTQRIGINSGIVFAGNVGSSQHRRREYTVMGDDVNLAARLMAAAQAGEIWISQEVWDQIQPGFVAEKMNLIQVRGKSGLFPVYRLQAARGLQDRVAHELYSEMVGRKTELTQLQDCLCDVLARGRKRIIALTGEAGVGKTRLVNEWRQWAETSAQADRPITWLVARGQPFGQKANGVFIEVVERLVGLTEGDTPERRWKKLSARIIELAELSGQDWGDDFENRLAYLGQFLGFDFSKRQSLEGRVKRLEDEPRQVQMRLAVHDIIERAALKTPLVLVFEDLHWADIDSLDMLKLIWEKTSHRAPVLFCLVYRNQKELPIWQAIQEIERSHPDRFVIEIKELHIQDHDQLLHNLLKTSRLDDEFRKMVFDATDGNPLYLEEVLHSLIEDRTIALQGDAGWQIVKSVESIRIQVPNTLYQIIQGRIDELDFASPGARRVLWMAAVIGEEFSEDLLKYLFVSTRQQESEENFWRHLDELKNADMVHELKGGEGFAGLSYRFRHGLVHKVAYESMLVENRREYHREVGRWLEEMCRDDLQRHYTMLADHYDKGQQWDKAFQYHLLAGEVDARAFASQSVTFHLRRALEIADYAAPDGDTLAHMHLELGKTLTILGEMDDAQSHLLAALALLGRAPAEKMAAVCYQMGCIHEMRGSFELALDWIQQGQAMLSGMQEKALEKARLYLLAGMVALRRSDLATAFEAADQALSLTKALAASPEAAQTHNLLGVLHRERGELDQAAFHCERSLTLYEQLANPLKVATVLKNLGVIAFERDDWPGAANAYQRALAMHEQVGDAYNRAMTMCNLADLYCHRGQLQLALEYAHKGLAGFKILGAAAGLVHAHENLGAVYLWLGELDRARTHLEQGLQLIQANDIQEFSADVLVLLAEVHLRAGAATTAETMARRALDIATEQATPVNQAIAQRVLGLVFQACGDTASAEEALLASRALVENQGQRYELGRTLLALAGLYRTDRERRPEARAMLEQAYAIFEKLGAELALAEAQALIQCLAN